MKKLITVILLTALLYLVSDLRYDEIYTIVCEQYAPAMQGVSTSEKDSNISVDESSKTDIPVDVENALPKLQLYALSACLMDADSGRVLYSKDAYNEMPMASTTKIMTLLIALEYGAKDEIVTVSTNAAKQPDVQLNINTGEQYYLGDLLYSLMLESHNDVAVAIAEHVGGSVEEFCNMMTAKAKAIGAMNTSFKTPNGLDAEGHYTTASDLALIGSYAIKNEEFLKITNAQIHQFDEITKGRSFTVNNKDRFLQMMEGALGIKTGFTGKAGYCFVGALKRGEKTFVSVVLGSGWPPNKNYKWTDTTKLMNLGLNSYTKQTVFSSIEDYKMLPVLEGTKPTVNTAIKGDVSLLLCDNDTVEVKYDLPDVIHAPISQNETVGTAQIFINNELYESLAILTKFEVTKINFTYCFKLLLNWVF